MTLTNHIENVVKDTPPIAVATLTLFGIELSSWVMILTAIYTIIRIATEVHTWYRHYKEKKREQSFRSRTE